MSAGLIAALTCSAGLLGLAIVALLRSYEGSADRVTEATRIRLRAEHPNGAHQSGPHWKP